MDDRVAAALDQHSRATAYAGDDDLVFAHPHTGHFLDASALLTRFKAALKRAEVEPVRFDDLRHTFATVLASDGVPIRTIQEWMGHADIQTTEIYAKYAPDPTGGRAWLERAFARAENPVLTAALDG